MKMGGEKKEERWKVRVPAKVPLTEINEYLMCQLCIGYLIDATAIIECQHTFCKSCILKYLETNSYCPICEVQLNIAKPLLSLRCDENLQKLVYKLVPGLVNSEIHRRKEFAVKLATEEEAVVEGLKEAEEFCFLAPDESVTLSLEYFKGEEVEAEHEDVKGEEIKSKPEVGSKKSPLSTSSSSEKDKANDRRYLQCPAAVSVGILKKFIRQKYGLSDDYRVDLLYNGDSENNLENELTLLDLSFIFKWKKGEPMCFHYRIFDRPSRNVPTRPPIKRTAPAVLDEPPPDDAPPSTGPHSAPSTKQPRLGGGSTPTSSSTTTTSDSKTQSVTGTLIQAKGQAGSSSKNVLGRGKSTPTREDDRDVEASGSSSSPAYSPQGSGYESLSPTAKNNSITTTSSSSPESPSCPLKISIKADGKTHRHRHRHHKEKHKRKSKSKSKSKDREKSKEKERYKYNAHPNPTQSQTISVKPSGKHRHRHHKNRDKDSDKNTLGTVSVSAEKGSTTAMLNVEEKAPIQAVTAPQSSFFGQRSRSSSVTSAGSGGVERRHATTAMELKSIPVPPASKPNPVQNNGQQLPPKGIGKIKIPDALQLQVPKSVTLIPVTPGLAKTTSRDKTQAPPRPNSSQTFTHPITNKSLHQITVTEVPPPGSKGPMTPSNVTPVSANVITIEKCSPNPSSHSTSSSKQVFNGPGSMEITKIYCDTKNGVQTQTLPTPGVKVKGHSASSAGVFESHSQKKLKGLDISITPTPPSYGKTQVPRNEEQTNYSGKLNVAGIPKIPGVSILPQAVHNANKEQQRKFSNSGLMSFSCTKINSDSSNGVKVNNVAGGGRLLSASATSDRQRSPSPATTVNGKQVGKTSRKGSADSVYDNSRGPSPSHLNQSRKMSLPISIVGSNTSFSHGGFGEHKPRDQNHNSGKSHKRALEHSLPASKKPRVESAPPSTQVAPPPKNNESLPLDLSGRSSRLTPPGSAENRPATPILSHMPLNQSQSSPKLSHKSQSTPSIDSIVENLTQKHQRGSVPQRSSISSNSSKESMSPPNPGSSPPMVSHPQSYHPDLLTLSNAAATARKMNHQKQSTGNAMSNLIAAANAIAYNCPTTNPMGPPQSSVAQMSPGSAAAAATLMLPGLLHQLGHHHQLSAMMLSPPGGLTGPQGIKTSMLGQSGIYGGFPGLNGRLPSYGGSVGPSPLSALSPPFSYSRLPSSSSGSSTSATLKIPTLNSSKSGSKSPTTTPPVSTSSTSTSSNGIAPPKGSKSPKTNGSSPPHVTSPPHQKPKPTGATFSFGISNFLKDTHGKSGVDPNAKAIVTSSSAGMMGQGGKTSTKHENKVKSELRSKPQQPTRSPQHSKEQSLPVSKLLGFESPPPSSRKPVMPEIVSKEESGKGSSRLGDLGLALGLIPCDPPMTLNGRPTTTFSTTIPVTTNPTITVTTPPPTKSFSIPSLLPTPPSNLVPSTTAQQQNQAVRQIPNPSLLSSRQNCVNNNNSTVNNGEGRIWKSVTNKGESSVTSKPQEPQSIELNMRLWIDRYESSRAQNKISVCPPKDTPTTTTPDEQSIPVKGNKSPEVTFSASVPSPPTTIETEQKSLKFKSDFTAGTSQGSENVLKPNLQEKAPEMIQPSNSLPKVVTSVKPETFDISPPGTKDGVDSQKGINSKICEDKIGEMTVVGGMNGELNGNIDADKMTEAEHDEMEKKSDAKIESVDEAPIVIQPQFGTTLMNEYTFNSNAEKIALETNIEDEKCDSPSTLVIDEDEEDVTVVQEREADNEQETGGQKEIRIEVPRILEGSLDTNDIVEALDPRGNTEDPPLADRMSPFLKALPDMSPSPTPLIGSESPLPMESLEPEVTTDSETIKTPDLDKVTKNNNNNVSPGRESPSPGVDLIPTTTMTSITTPPANQTPPLPTTN